MTNAAMVWDDGLPDGCTGQDIDLYLLNEQLDEIDNTPADDYMTEEMELIDRDDCIRVKKDYDKIVDLFNWNDCMDWEARMHHNFNIIEFIYE